MKVWYVSWNIFSCPLIFAEYSRSCISDPTQNGTKNHGLEIDFQNGCFSLVCSMILIFWERFIRISQSNSKSKLQTRLEIMPFSMCCFQQFERLASVRLSLDSDETIHRSVFLVRHLIHISVLVLRSSGVCHLHITFSKIPKCWNFMIFQVYDFFKIWCSTPPSPG